jgi:hypothetical protein
MGINFCFSQCSEPITNRVLLVGDSWAAFMNADQTITEGLRNMGHSDKKFVSNVTIAENGADTWDFVDGPKQDAIQDIIDANPQIDVIHLSIGGNDLLGSWNTSFTQAQTDSLAAEVEDRLNIIVDFLQNTRSGMRVFWAGYTYPNFGEIIEDMAPFQSAHPFYSTWDDMGQPDFITINSILNDMSDSVALSAAADPQLDFVRAQGILQYQFGQETPLGIAPGGTYAQFEAPLPLGYPDYPSPKEAMRLYAGIFLDPFHLSTESYLRMFTYQAEKFYQKFFMDDLYVLSEGGTADGSVSSDGVTSAALEIGESGGNEIATVVSFDTQSMADTTLSSASIFLRRESLTGTNPFSGNETQIKMISGNFGATANVEADDFLASGDAEGITCRFGSHLQDGHWVRFDLTTEMIAAINNQNKTQFVITVPGFTGGVMSFSDASNPDYAPVLNLNYGPEPSGVNEIRTAKELPVYPIPTTGGLTIDVDPNELRSVQVLNVLGSVVLEPTPMGNRIDISELPNGAYVLKLTTDSGVSAKRIVKR